MENEPGLLSKIIFSDEALFHVNRKVNRHNVRICMSTACQVERNSPKINVFCVVTHRTVYGPFFFEEPTITEQTYLAMITNWLVPRLAPEKDDYIFQ